MSEYPTVFRSPYGPSRFDNQPCRVISSGEPSGVFETTFKVEFEDGTIVNARPEELHTPPPKE